MVQISGQEVLHMFKIPDPFSSAYTNDGKPNGISSNLSMGARR